MPPRGKKIFGSLACLTKQIKTEVIIVIVILKSLAFNDFSIVIAFQNGGKMKFIKFKHITIHQ